MRKSRTTIKDSLVEIMIGVAIMAILVAHIFSWIGRSAHKRNSSRTQQSISQVDSSYETITM